jgi:tetratricopeptide (TPR) repeat protein
MSSPLSLFLKCFLYRSSNANNEIVFALTDDDYLEAFEKEFNIDNDLDTSHFKKSPCPPDISLDDFRGRLDKVNDQVYKKVRNEGIGEILSLEKFKIVYEYSLFRKTEQEPFDSNEICSRLGVVQIQNEKLATPLPGILEAISTMKYREESIFLLSHQVMYGPLGILNRVPPKCDIVARIRIYKLFDCEGNEVKFERTCFEKTMLSVGKGCSNARRQFRARNYDAAIKIYKKNIEILEKTHLADEREESEMKEFLAKMYLEQALCHNKIKQPQKACIAIRELEKLQSIKQNAKALFAKGRALMLLKDYKPARKLYTSALKLEPTCKKILAAIQELEECVSKTAEYAAEQKEREKQYELEVEELQIQAEAKCRNFFLSTQKYQ